RAQARGRLGAAGEADLGAGVAEDVALLLLVLVLVHRDPGRAQALGRVAGDDPLEPVVGDAGDAIAAADAERRQRGAKIVHERTGLAIRVPGPGAALAHAVQGPV